MLQGAFLSFAEILKHRPGRNGSRLILGNSQSVQMIHMEMLPQKLSAGIVGKKAVFQSSHHRMKTVFQLLQIDSGHVEGLVADNLRRRKFIDFV